MGAFGIALIEVGQFRQTQRRSLLEARVFSSLAVILTALAGKSGDEKKPKFRP
jgi:hypothetical protein